MAARIVVFTADLNYSVRSGIAAVAEAVQDASWLVVLHKPRKRLGTLLRSQWRQLQRNGWRWLPHLARDLARRVVAVGTPADSPHAPGRDLALDRLEARHDLGVVPVDDINGEQSIAAVRAFQPDLGLSLAAPILKSALFSIPRLGTLNLHKGRVPDYRGMPPAFWELWNDEREVGCTVHRVEARLDAGDVVARATVRREAHSTLRGLQLALDETGIGLMRDAVLQTLAGTATPVPQGAGGTTYRKPTLGQQAELARRLRRSEPQAEPALRRAAKELAFSGLIALWYAAWRWFARPRVTVLLYHRVSDDARDNLTVGVEQFDRQMALLRRHCEVLPIEAVASLDRPPRSRRPLVCVTFDDGYLDNFIHAVPILKRHGIPAAFFVATGIVGSTRPFPHDLRRGNQPLPVMSWPQLRAMVRDGFTVGSHSVSHIDCAREPEEVVKRELEQSLRDLRRELGVDGAMFAYPYGGRQHMTRERLALVKAAGFTACLSAYGGTNAGAIDRFDIRRGGIHWAYSDRPFLARCLGYA